METPNTALNDTTSEQGTSENHTFDKRKRRNRSDSPTENEKRALSNVKCSLWQDSRAFIPNNDWLTVDIYNNPVKPRLLRFDDKVLDRDDLTVFIEPNSYPLTLWYGPWETRHVYTEEYLIVTSRIGEPDQHIRMWPLSGPFTYEYEFDAKRMANEARRVQLGLVPRESRKIQFFDKRWPDW